MVLRFPSGFSAVFAVWLFAGLGLLRLLGVLRLLRVLRLLGLLRLLGVLRLFAGFSALGGALNVANADRRSRPAVSTLFRFMTALVFGPVFSPHATTVSMPAAKTGPPAVSPLSISLSTGR